MKLLGRIDGAENPGSLSPNVSAAVNGVALCGTLAGQLYFGWLGDKLGRKKDYGMTLMLMVICSIGSRLSFGRTPQSILSTLCFFRFWLCLKIGGDYTLSATIMSEYSNKKTCGAFIVAVFDMQGLGILVAGVFAIILSSAFKAAFEDDAVGFVIMYALTFFFSNFKPNAATFIVPAEIFPARLRATCHGISYTIQLN